MLFSSEGGEANVEGPEQAVTHEVRRMVKGHSWRVDFQKTKNKQGGMSMSLSEDRYDHLS